MTGGTAERRRKPGEWRARRSATPGLYEAARVNALGAVYETGPVPYRSYAKAKADADVWNQMEREELAEMWVESDNEATGPGAALATLRKLAGLTVDEAARRADMAAPFLRRVENGEIVGTPGFFAHVAGVYAAELQRAGIEPSSCGERSATYAVPAHTCQGAEVST